MYDLQREILVASGSASAHSRNLSVIRSDGKGTTYAATVQKCQVNTISWDAKIEGMTNDQILAKDPNAPAGTNPKAHQVIQAKYCPISGRHHPVLVVCTINGAMIMEWNGSALLHWIPLPKGEREHWSFAKGIASQGDTLFIGCHTGQIFCLAVKETTVKQKDVLKEHASMIADLDADRESIGSVGGDGTIVCWGSDLKSVFKISTQLSFTCIAVNKSYVFCATTSGLIIGYKIKTGEVMMEISAHVRPINTLDISLETGLILSGSEDSFVRVWKIIKGELLEAECIYSKALESVPIVGGCFLDGRGHSFAVTGYDHPTIFYFTRITKKQAS